jgi:hypothetical protein
MLGRHGSRVRKITSQWADARPNCIININHSTLCDLINIMHSKPNTSSKSEYEPD